MLWSGHSCIWGREDADLGGGGHGIEVTTPTADVYE